ncbi:hypothetical protein BLNAU_15054 [Blattamonas nauphoetae]|uniref:Nucleosome assembly protein n=1 Tax=Blattamonas nauphoetae TaxID=2049346 RepID=A0ABQ9XGN0_9EUKA|nr:hypothetical protein BLNAU_15054 [Blattamonas nauphoetae]
MHTSVQKSKRSHPIEFHFAIEENLLDQYQTFQKELQKQKAQALDQVYVTEAQTFKLSQDLFEKRSTILRSLPAFWSHLLLKHHELSAYFQDELSVVALSFLRDITVTYADTEDIPFTMTLIFDENDYFSNQSLSCTVSRENGEAVFTEKSSIEWKSHYGLDDDKPSFFHLWSPEVTSASLIETIRKDIYVDPFVAFAQQDDPFSDDDSEQIEEMESDESDD